MPALPNIVIGLGAAKSGTTWLHDYLTSHPQAHMRKQKEIFYFGRKDGSNREAVRKRNIQIAKGALSDLSTRGLNGHSFGLLRDIIEWGEYLGDPSTSDARYVDYLRLRHELHDDIRICADISPQYGTMSKVCFAEMDAAVPDARYVFLVREPVSRFWSHCNHLTRQDILREKHNNDQPLPGSVARLTTEEVALRFLKGDAGLRARLTGHSDYKATLDKLLALVGRDRVFIGFYECLTDGVQVRSLCEFLGIDYVAPNASKRVNVGDGVRMPETIHAQARAVFESDYEALRRHASGALPDKWNEVFA